MGRVEGPRWSFSLVGGFLKDFGCLVRNKLPYGKGLLLLCGYEVIGEGF